MGLAAKVVHDSLTLADGESYDLGRILAAAGLLTFLGLSIYEVCYHGTKFDPQGWGAGFGLAVAGYGAMQALKNRSEIASEPPRTS